MDAYRFKDKYASILKSFVESQQEQYLAQAAELGRKLVLANVPPEDIAEIHEDAVKALAEEFPDRTLLETSSRVSAPLMEMLMAYGLAFREWLDERKQAEQLLQKEKDKSQKYLDVAAVMLVAIDTEQRVGLINKKGCEILGCEEEEILGKNWFDNFLPERIRDQVREIFEKLIGAEADASDYCENPILTKNGEERLIAWHNTVLRDEKGSVIATLSSGEDITERKKAEEQIAKLAKFPAENPNSVLRISGRGTVVYANEASAILLKAWDCRVGKSLPEPWNEFVMDSLSSGQGQQTEVKCDGRTFSLTFAPVVDANYVNVYGHDITERKKAEQELAQALAWQEAIFEGSRDAVFVTDANSRFVIVNHAACELTGYSKQELLQMRIPDLHEQQDLAAYNLFHERIMAGEEIVSEAKILRKDGTKVDTEFNNRCIKISGNAYMHTVARDITVRCAKN